MTNDRVRTNTMAVDAEMPATSLHPSERFGDRDD
jgi:hypothetical protein